MKKYKIGTRASPLAVRQTEIVIEALNKVYGVGAYEFEMVKIITSGDKIQNRPLSEIGGKGLFTKELEEGLEANEIDFAVHSLKDMPAKMDSVFSIDCILERENPYDGLVGPYKTLSELPQGAKLGTSSPRRRSFAVSIRPDLEVVDFRGNVQTRLKKLEDGVADTTIMAMAGLKRLGMDHLATQFSLEEMIPAVSQGAICIQYIRDRKEVHEFLQGINHAKTNFACSVERAFLEEFEGGCKTPLAAHLVPVTDNESMFYAMIGRVDGSRVIRDQMKIANGEAIALARNLARRFKLEAGPGFFD